MADMGAQRADTMARIMDNMVVVSMDSMDSTAHRDMATMAVDTGDTGADTLHPTRTIGTRALRDSLTFSTG